MMRRVPIDSAAPVVVFASRGWRSRSWPSRRSRSSASPTTAAPPARARRVRAVVGRGAAAVAAPARSARSTRRCRRSTSRSCSRSSSSRPNTLVGVQLAALFLVAAHAHFQGERRGVMIARARRGRSRRRRRDPRRRPGRHRPARLLRDRLLPVARSPPRSWSGLLRTSESASRLRARELSRRTMQAESEVRRRVAESIHDGPVQELIGLDMILVRRRAVRPTRATAAGLIDEARDLVSRNVRALRDEIVDLGPYAFQEMTFEIAIENCMPVWQRRYGFEVRLAIEHIDLPPEMAGDLFRIAQEAVVNAGRHAEASQVEISLRTVGGERRAAGGRRRRTASRATVDRTALVRARPPGAGEHARARRAARRRARDRVVGPRHARPRARPRRAA